MRPYSGLQKTDFVSELVVLCVELVELCLCLLATWIAMRSEQGVDRQGQSSGEGDARNPSCASLHSLVVNRCCDRSANSQPDNEFLDAAQPKPRTWRRQAETSD